MKQINFKDPVQFRELEKDAFDGKLDVEDFPAAEYRYFDRLANLGYRHRASKLPMDFCRELREQAYKDYVADCQELDAQRQYCAQCQTAIMASDQLRCQIEKATYEEKLPLALECIEVMTGERGFKERNLRRSE